MATVVFQTATPSGNQYTRTTLGTFTVTGPFTDAGTLRMASRIADARINATATLIGARAVLALSVRGRPAARW